jgi:hypothetical protein
VYIIESGSNDYNFQLGPQFDDALISSVLEFIGHAVRVCTKVFFVFFVFFHI